MDAAGGRALLGLGYGTMVPAGQTVALNLVGSARAGVGISSYFLFVDAGTGVGPFVIGALVGPLGFRQALLVGVAFAVLGLVAMVLLERRITRAGTAPGAEPREPPPHRHRPKGVSWGAPA